MKWFRNRTASDCFLISDTLFSTQTDFSIWIENVKHFNKSIEVCNTLLNILSHHQKSFILYVK